MTLPALTGPARTFSNFTELANFLWSVADLLRGDYKQADYGKVILPFTVLRRFDCVLEPTRDAVRTVAAKSANVSEGTRHKKLMAASGAGFYNTSKLDFRSMCADPDNINEHLKTYIHSFDPQVEKVLGKFEIEQHIERMHAGGILYLVTRRFAEVDLHPSTVPNHVMGSVFEELIRKFAEQSNETAGEHFTPREVIKLMVSLLLHDDEHLATPGIVKKLYDPACGTGGMLSVADEYIREINKDAEPKVYGQELNAESWAICRADMLIKGHDAEKIVLGNSFSQDGHSGEKFDYMLSNPPFGVEWKKVQEFVEKEHTNAGLAGRFGAGLPRINDGSLLFLQHMLSKMQPVDKDGSRIAIVFNGSPLFTGDAGSGESEIRRWIIEHDWLEAIVALPDQLFYNTGISTYVWLLTNRKSAARKGRVQLIDGSELFRKMRKSLGDKRNELSDEHIAELVKLHGDGPENDKSKWFRNEDFGYRRIVVERPLRLSFVIDERVEARLDESAAFAKLAKSSKKGDKGREESEQGAALQASIKRALATMRGERWDDRAAFVRALDEAMKREKSKLSAAARKAVVDALGERDPSAKACVDEDGRVEADSELRDSESVPLTESVQEYMEREVLAHAPDAWVDESKTRVGYEIPFSRHFYRYTPPRELSEIESELRTLESEITALLKGVLGG